MFYRLTNIIDVVPRKGDENLDGKKRTSEIGRLWIRQFAGYVRELWVVGLLDKAKKTNKTIDVHKIMNTDKPDSGE